MTITQQAREKLQQMHDDLGKNASLKVLKISTKWKTNAKAIWMSSLEKRKNGNIIARLSLPKVA